jgi:hypothetical protein
VNSRTGCPQILRNQTLTMVLAGGRLATSIHPEKDFLRIIRKKLDTTTRMDRIPDMGKGRIGTATQFCGKHGRFATYDPAENPPKHQTKVFQLLDKKSELTRTDIHFLEDIENRQNLSDKQRRYLASLYNYHITNRLVR